MLCASAAVITAAYLLDSIGSTMFAPLLAVVAIAAAVPAAWTMRERAGPGAWAGIIAAIGGVGAYAMWIASPAFLPVTDGPDVVHHLQLIHVIARTGRLPHDPALAPFLAEMMNYTPGAHILAAAFSNWVRVDPLRVVYPLAVLFAALQAGIAYEILRRLLPVSRRAAVQALAAPLLLLAPVYFLNAFVQYFFLSQVVSETFMTAMLLAAIAWCENGARRHLVFAAICGVGVVLTWPVWIGPGLIVVFAAVAVRPSSWRQRAVYAGAVAAPAAVALLIHRWLHPGAAAIVTAAGAVTAPSPAAFGRWFLVFAGAGVAVARRARGARLVIVCVAATVLQALALAWLVSRAGSGSYYMPFKMMYLVIVPAAVLGGLGLARNADFLVAWSPRPAVVAAGLPIVIAFALLRGSVPVKRVHGSISLPARDAGLWARDHLPPACVDYFSRYWLTGFWLHFDVLDNPRLSERTRVETFDFPDVAAKWIEGRGLPYAIVEDMVAIPREIRPDMEPLYQRGTFVVVRNRRAAACHY